MKTYAILFGILIIGITFFMISSYSLYDKCIDCEPIYKQHNRVRCPPHKAISSKPTKITLANNKKTHNISIYEDSSVINNKGFVNELMYKPTDHSTDYEFGFNEITNPSIPLNDVCEDTTNLPIRNINVNFLLENKEAKLIL